MNIRNILTASAVLGMLATAVSASAEPLPGTEVRSLVAGKRVYLSTPYGVELPLHYRANGTVSGDVSGISLARMFAPRETGKWWVDGARLCQQWPNWYDGKTLCFRISRTGADSISWVRQDGLKGTARIEG